MGAPRRLPLLLLALGPVGRASASPPAPSPRNRTLLFIDEHEVLYSSAVARELRPLTRHTPGTPVLPMDRPWEKLLAYSAVHVVDGEYRMWCAPRPQPAPRMWCAVEQAPHCYPPPPPPPQVPGVVGGAELHGLLRHLRRRGSLDKARAAPTPLG